MRPAIIHPAFWTDETIGALSPCERLLFIGTWNLATHDGKVRWEREYLRSALFGMGPELSLWVVDTMMERLVRDGLITVLPAKKGRPPEALIVNFVKYQTKAVRVTKAARTRLPANIPDAEDADYAIAKWSDAGVAADYSVEHQRFRDYHIKEGSLSADWHASWRTWVGNKIKWAKEGKGERKTHFDRGLDAATRILREDQQEGDARPPARPGRGHAALPGSERQGAGTAPEDLFRGPGRHDRK